MVGSLERAVVFAEPRRFRACVPCWSGGGGSEAPKALIEISSLSNTLGGYAASILDHSPYFLFVLLLLLVISWLMLFVARSDFKGQSSKTIR